MLSDELLCERVRSELQAELADVEPRSGFLEGIWSEARESRPASRFNGHGGAARGARFRWFSLGNLAAGVAGIAALVVAVVVLVLAHRHESQSPPIPTTDAVPPSAIASPRLPVGAPAGPLRVPANSFQGAAIPSTVRLVAQAPDPHGGLPWGLREFRTTRGQTCLQVGRVQGGTIGVIGQDGAWADDHRFHPIAPNAYTGDSCSATDANGHAFDNVALNGGGAIASAVVPWGTGLQGDGCGGSNAGRPEPSCPTQDLRNLNYGLLGPEAVRITYVGAGRRRYTESTNGPDGAYLIVGAPGGHQATCVFLRNGGRGCGGSGMTSGPSLASGVITEVRYRTGETCRLPAPTSTGVREASCAPVGYVPARRPAITAAQVVSPVTVRALPAQHYCASGSLSIAPCKHGRTSLKGEQRSLLIEISFTPRVAVSNGNSYYEYADQYPTGPGARCSGRGAGSSGTTLKNIRAGERIVFQDQVLKTCPGTVTGIVAFVPDAGAAGFASGPSPSPSPGHDGSLLVGTFKLTIK